MSSTTKPKRPSAPNRAFVRKDPQQWKRYGWTSAPNSLIRAGDLPLEEVGLWVWLASHTRTFEVSGDVLWNAKDSLGRDKAYRLLRSLEERGLLLRHHETGDDGVPYIVYDLQPEPVPPEQRTARPRTPRKKKSPATPDSWTGRNPATSRADNNHTDTSGAKSGFLDGQESGDEQGKQSPSGAGVRDESEGVSPGRVIPGRAGESYKEVKDQEKDQPTTAAHAAPTTTASELWSDVGWLEDASQQTRVAAGGGQEQTAPAPNNQESSGACLLRSLRLPGQATPLSGKAIAQWAPTVDQALVGAYSPVALVERLTNGLGGARNPAGVVVSRLGELHTEQQQPQRGSARSGVPSWCGECGSHWPDERAKKNPRFRTVLAEDGETERLCTCHPQHPDRQPVVAA